MRKASQSALPPRRHEHYDGEGKAIDGHDGLRPTDRSARLTSGYEDGATENKDAYRTLQIQQNDGNVDLALDAMLNGSIQIGQPSYQGWKAQEPLEQRTTPPQASEPTQDSIRPLLSDEDRPGTPMDQASWADRASEGLRRSERNTRKRNSPVDLTADDEDEDLRKAMQASLESESNRQKRHQEYGVGPVLPARPSAHGVSADDEALTRAIEASMLQSHFSTRAQSPQMSTSQLESMGAYQMRTEDKPVVVLPPTPTMHLFASVLQAIHASGPFRQAILSSRLVDLRLRQHSQFMMDEYWRGASPSGVPRLPQESWQEAEVPLELRESFDTFMRLSTLYTFLAFTKRPFVLADDVIIQGPLYKNYAYVMNSERKPAHDIFSCYVQGLLDSIASTATLLENGAEGAIDTKSFMRTFQSFTVTAVEPQKEVCKQARQPRGEAYEVVVSTLRRSSVNNTIHRALYALLAEEQTLISEAGQSLFFCVGQVNTYDPVLGASSLSNMSESGTSAEFVLERRIYLDTFMFHKRDGVRLGLATEEVKTNQRRMDELDKYRKSIITFQGEDSRTLLRSSLKHLAALQSEDAFRASSIAEAGPRLEAILAHLEEEISGVDAELEWLRNAIKQSQTHTMASFEEFLTREENQSMAYDLQAAVFDDNDISYTYVHHRLSSDDEAVQKWWRIQGSVAQEVREDDVLQDRNNLSFVVYTAVQTRGSEPTQETKSDDNGSSFPHPQDGVVNMSIRHRQDQDWWAKQAVVEAIEYDNVNFANQLASRSSLDPAQHDDHVPIKSSTL